MMFKKQVLCALTALCTTSLLLRFLSNHVDSAKVLNQIISALNLPLLQVQMRLRPIPAGSSCKKPAAWKWSTQFTWKIEEQENEIERLKSELTNRYADLDQRLELLQQKIEPAEDTPAEDNQQDISPSLSSNAPTTTNQTSTTQQSSEQEKAAYTIALDAYKNGGAAKAIAPMQNFIKNNPNSVYISNAHFWLAEFNLSIDPPNFNEAKKNYLIVVDRYPNSAKASTAVYQLYNISKDVEKNATLASQYKAKLLKNYPKAEEVKFLK